MQRSHATHLRMLTSALLLGSIFVGLSSVAQAHGSRCYQFPSDVDPTCTGSMVAPPINPGPVSKPAEDARLDAVRTDIAERRFAAAERTLWAMSEEIALSSTDDISVRVLLGGLLLDSGRPADALEIATPLDLVDTYDAQLLLGRAYTATGHDLAQQGAAAEDVSFHHELALAPLERAVELAPAGDGTAAVDALNVRLYTLGDVNGALAFADQLLENAFATTEGAIDTQASGAGEVQLLRGCARGYAYWDAAQSGDADSAKLLWQRAVDDLRAAQTRLADERSEPWIQLAWLGLQEQGDIDQALADAREAALRGAPAPLLDVASVSAGRGLNETTAQALLSLVEGSAQGQDLSLLVGARDDRRALSERLSFAVLSSDSTLEQARRIHAALSAASTESGAVWNNYALLCRDTGAYTESYKAYVQALQITGPDPRLLNDTALVLHYHLMGEDAELAAQARGLYLQAIDLAQQTLAEQPVDPGQKQDLESALTDARNNLALLDAQAAAPGD